MPVPSNLPGVIFPQALYLNNLHNFPPPIKTLILDHKEDLEYNGALRLDNLPESKLYLEHRLQTIESIKENIASENPNAVGLIQEVLREVNNPSSKITSSHKVDLLLALLQAGVKAFAVDMPLKGAAIQALKDLHSRSGKKLDNDLNKAALDEFFNELLSTELNELEDGITQEEKLDEWVEEALKDHPFKAPMLGAIARKSYLLGEMEDAFPFLDELIKTIAGEYKDGKLSDQDISPCINQLAKRFALSPARYTSIAKALFDAINQNLFASMTDMPLKEELSKSLTDAIAQAKNRGQA